MSKRLKVGIVGLQAGRSWAARAHVPALRALAGTFEIAGVANTSRSSAQAAADAMGIATAFADAAELVTSPEIDVVAVTVRVPHHMEIVKGAIEAGKHVYCEWPLGRNLAEAEALARLARERGVLGVIGTQARLAAPIQHLRRLIADGFIGQVLSSTLVARGGGWGGIVPDERNHAYLLDESSGATMLTIPMGHAIAAVTEALGDIASLSAVLATRRAHALVADTGATLPVSAPDQALLSGLLVSGAPVSMHYRGGAPRDGNGFMWEINGTEGDLRVSGPLGHPQLVPLMLAGARGSEKAFVPIELPQTLLSGYPSDIVPGNVARVYARMAADLDTDIRTAPSFDDAVALHRIIDAIQHAASSGQATGLR